MVHGWGASHLLIHALVVSRNLEEPHSQREGRMCLKCVLGAGGGAERGGVTAASRCLQDCHKRSGSEGLRHECPQVYPRPRAADANLTRKRTWDGFPLVPFTEDNAKAYTKHFYLHCHQ